MKRTILPFCLTAVIALCMILCNACEKYVLPEISIDQDTINVPMSGGKYNIKVTTNVQWTIDEFGMGKWIRFSEITGSNDYQMTDYEITMTVDANDTGEPRSQVVPITTASFEKKIFVYQEGPEPELEGM